MITVILEGKEYQLDVEQAEKLGLLKEKSDRVRSWEEFKEKYCTRSGYFYEVHERNALKTASPISIGDQLTAHESKALSAFSKLLKLRRDWIGKWEPDWTDCTTYKFVISHVDNGIVVSDRNIASKSLSFPTKQMAEEFLKTFRSLLEEAKILI